MAQELFSLKYQKELLNAESARKLGNEGLARVCARRAAGILAEKYLTERGYPVSKMSAYQKLRVLASIPSDRPEITICAKKFLVHVSTDGTLQPGIDLINEAKWLANTILI